VAVAEEVVRDLVMRNVCIVFRILFTVRIMCIVFIVCVVCIVSIVSNALCVLCKVQNVVCTANCVRSE
jgi:hypothetical protein